MFTMLIPALRHAPCGYLNFNDLARKDECSSRSVPRYVNRYADPAYAEHVLSEYHRRMGWVWSYGGYHENRSSLWSEVPYLKERGTFLHLGVDFNVPVGTAIAASRACTVVHIDDDHPEPYGWGPRVVVQLKEQPVCLIFAHLQKVACRVGQQLTQNDIIAEVGAAPYNGGWFSHFHVQAVVSRMWPNYKLHPNELDGYGRVEDQLELGRTFPDPLPYLRVW